MPAPVDEGVRTFVGKLVGWTEEGKMLKDVWVSAAGSTYRAARRRLHQRPDPVLLFRQLAGREPLDQDRRRLRLGGDRLALRHRRLLRPAGRRRARRDQVHPEPRGGGQGHRVPRQRAGGEGVHRAHAVPAGAPGRHRQAAASTFDSDDPNVQPALEKFVAASQLVAPAAALLPPWKWANAYYAALVTRTSQVMAGELPLEDAFARMDQDIADQVAQAQQ